MMIAPPPISSAAHQDKANKDSDSDWDDDDDDDDDFITKKIDIKIKPIGQLTPSKISASVDELRATVGTWKSMANINLIKPNSRRSHHQSTLQLDKLDAFSQLNQKPNQFKEPPPLEFNSTPTTDNFTIGQDSNVIGLNFPNSVATNNNKNSINIIGNEQGGFVFPVAFAIQECLNVRLLMGPGGSQSTNLIGRVKMAVPNNANLLNQLGDQSLHITVDNSIPWNTMRLNDQFVMEVSESDRLNSETILTEDNPTFNGYSHFDDFSTTMQTISSKKLSINLRAIHEYVKSLNRGMSAAASYHVLPELLNYTIRSHEQPENASFGGALCETSSISPINIQAHWLCDLNITKVRVDLKKLFEEVDIKTEEIKNIKLSLQVNGGVVSCQSKPHANWSQIDSRLTWSFPSLNELLLLNEGNSSCMARFDLDDGPSTPSDVSLQFAITGKTLTRTRISLQDSMVNFKIAKQKSEVRTGIFKCEPVCL